MAAPQIEQSSSHSSAGTPSSEGNAVLDAEKDNALKHTMSPEDLKTLNKLDSKMAKAAGEEDEDPFRHLPPHEKEILHRQLDVPIVKVTFWTLYRYATRNDILIIILSSISSVIGGAMLPLMTV